MARVAPGVATPIDVIIHDSHILVFLIIRMCKESEIIDGVNVGKFG